MSSDTRNLSYPRLVGTKQTVCCLTAAKLVMASLCGKTVAITAQGILSLSEIREVMKDKEETSLGQFTIVYSLSFRLGKDKEVVPFQ